MSPRLALVSSLLSLIAGACAAPPPPIVHSTAVVVQPLPTASSPVIPQPPLVDPAIVSVTSVVAPQGFKLDGDVAEWGSLLPPVPPPPKPPAKGTPPPPPPKEPSPPDPNPRDATSHLAVAVSSDGAVIAADLGETARGGIWLGIGSEAPDVPPIGQYQRGGGIREFNCDVDDDSGEPNPPEIVTACRTLLQRHTDFVAEHEARFEKLYRIDQEGIHATDSSGALTAIEGAQAVFKGGPQRATVEISLPAKALPRVTDAPLVSLRFTARAATTPKPPVLEPTRWVWLDLAAPVGFEPWSDLRAIALADARSRSIGARGLSYQPGDPLHVESITYLRGIYSPTGVRSAKETLYTKEATLGEIEIGYASAFAGEKSVAIFQQSKLVNLIPLDGAPMGLFERDGEVHVVTLSHSIAEDIGADNENWSVLAIAGDGTSRDPLDHGVENVPWREVTEFHTKNLDTFGVRGWTSFTATGQDEGLELAWHWDKRAKMYTGKRRRIPIHRTPPPKGR
jgi:hypothetical protein